jgi:hypothetical protein
LPDAAARELGRDDPHEAVRARRGSGELTAPFLGRTHIAGVEPGTRIRLHGTVGISADGRPVTTNPAYDLLT